MERKLRAEQHGDGRRQKQHGQGIAGARLTEEVHGVGGGADLVAIEGDVLQQLRQQRGGLEGEEVVVQAEEHQRQHHGDEAFVLQLQADLGHHPAQQAGDGHDEQGDQQQEQNARQQVQRGGGHRGPIDDDGRQHHHTGVHEAHEVHPQQPGGDEGIHRNGEGEHPWAGRGWNRW